MPKNVVKNTTEITEVVPRHLGFIVDGNRRWAKERGLPTVEGHRQGFDVVKKVLKWCIKRGVTYVSFYLFSTENWSRTEEEVGYLMGMVKLKMKSLAQELKKNGIKLSVLGSRDKLDPEIVGFIDEAEELTKDGTKGTVCVCFNYGGKQEIVDAVKKIDGEVTEEAIDANLYHPEVPPVDMVVRTSGEERISGFMLWRAAYAEMLFLKRYWPDMDEPAVKEVLAEYASRNRRFGK